MGNHGESKFGNDLAILHEALLTGRKVGADRAFWHNLAHDEAFFRSVVGAFEKTHDLTPIVLPLMPKENIRIPCLGPRWSQVESMHSSMMDMRAIDLSCVELVEPDWRGRGKRFAHNHWMRRAVLDLQFKKDEVRFLDGRCAATLLENQHRIPHGWVRKLQTLQRRHSSHRLHICFDGEQFVREDSYNGKGVVGLYVEGNIEFGNVKWASSFLPINSASPCQAYDLSAVLMPDRS